MLRERTQETHKITVNEIERQLFFCFFLQNKSKRGEDKKRTREANTLVNDQKRTKQTKTTQNNKSNGMAKRSGMKEKSCALGSGADEPMVD